MHSINDRDLLLELRRRLDSGAITQRQLHESRCDLDPATFDYWYDLCDTGTIINQTDTIPLIQRLYYDRTPARPVSVLDVGAGTCGGVALLGKMFGMAGPSVMKLDVTALELPDERLRRYVNALYPGVRLIFEDVYRHAAVYNLVQSSNVVEHIADPVPFIHQMQALARDYVMITTPIMEIQRIDGHCNTIDMAFIAQFSPIEVLVYTNVGWKPHGPVVTFLPPGLADGRGGDPWATCAPPDTRPAAMRSGRAGHTG